MRAVREQPRLATAKALGLLCLAACGLVLGLSLGGDNGADASDRAARAAQLRLITSERTVRGQADHLHETRAQLERSRTARARTAARLRTANRAHARLRRDLRTANRANAKLRRDLRTANRANATLRRDLRRVRRALLRARERS